MTSRVLRRIVPAATLVFVLSLAGSSGQDRPQQRPLRHDAAATVKLITVRVLGPDGRPVTDLRKEDFILREDGQIKTITEFEVHAVTEAGMTVIPPRPQPDQTITPENARLNRKFFFFFDLQAADRAGRAKAENAALQFLETQAKPGDEAAVLGFYAMSGFFVREYLTTDLALIRRAIKGAVEAPPSSGEMIAVGPADGDRTIRRAVTQTAGGEENSASGNIGGRPISDRPDFYSPQAVFVPGTSLFQRRDFADRMADLAEVFKTIPGTKNLVLFTSRNLGSAWERLGRLFGGSGTAVFAVNTQDWGAETSFLSLSLAPGKKRGDREPLLIDLFRLIPKDGHPVLGEIRSDQNRLTAVLPFEIKPEPVEGVPPLLAVEANLISRADGAARPVEVAVLDQKTFGRSPEILVAEIMLPALRPGAYDLELTVEDIGTGRRASLKKALDVR